MDQFKSLLDSLRKERDDLNLVIATLEGRLRRVDGRSTRHGFKRVKRVLSAEARAAISRAQKLRWSKVRKAA